MFCTEVKFLILWNLGHSEAGRMIESHSLHLLFRWGTSWPPQVFSVLRFSKKCQWLHVGFKWLWVDLGDGNNGGDIKIPYVSLATTHISLLKSYIWKTQICRVKYILPIYNIWHPNLFLTYKHDCKLMLLPAFLLFVSSDI